MTALLRGRVWCFGDDVNTDLILPIEVIPLPRQERARHVFRANRPGWASQVREGDMLVAGRNFGMGSGRPAALALKDLGVRCVLAESINGLFLRNCVNFALPALEVPGVRALFDEHDIAEVAFEAGVVEHPGSRTRLSAPPWPEPLLRCLRSGGLVQRLETDGLLHPVTWEPPPEPAAPSVGDPSLFTRRPS